MKNGPDSLSEIMIADDVGLIADTGDIEILNEELLKINMQINVGKQKVWSFQPQAKYTTSI